MSLVRLIRVLLMCAGLIGSSAGAAAVASHVAPSQAVHRPVQAASAPAGGPAAAAPGATAGSAGTQAGATPGTQTPAPTGTTEAGGSTGTTGSSAPAAAPADSGVAPIAGPAGNGFVYIGSVAGGYDRAVQGTGVDLANHTYSFFTGKVPDAEMLTVSAGSIPWRTVAAAGPGTQLYNDIVRWAQTIKARPGTVMLAYNHEPEAHDRLTLGSASDFIAAWRHVHSIFDQQGVSNVQWTWQMTAYAFRVKSTSEQAAAKWYPGDEFVDNVGADAYNWISCGATGTGTYNEMSALGDPVIAFARAHGKAASFPEFASHANGNRVQWMANAHQYFIDNRDILTAAFYFNRPPTIASNADCQWGLTQASEYGALRQMAQDTQYFRV